MASGGSRSESLDGLQLWHTWWEDVIGDPKVTIIAVKKVCKRNQDSTSESTRRMTVPAGTRMPTMVTNTTELKNKKPSNPRLGGPCHQRRSRNASTIYSLPPSRKITDVSRRAWTQSRQLMNQAQKNRRDFLLNPDAKGNGTGKHKCSIKGTGNHHTSVEPHRNSSASKRYGKTTWCLRPRPFE